MRPAHSCGPRMDSTALLVHRAELLRRAALCDFVGRPLCQRPLFFLLSFLKERLNKYTKTVLKVRSKCCSCDPGNCGVGPGEEARWPWTFPAGGRDGEEELPPRGKQKNVHTYSVLGNCRNARPVCFLPTPESRPAHWRALPRSLGRRHGEARLCAYDHSSYWHQTTVSAGSFP